MKKLLLISLISCGLAKATIVADSVSDHMLQKYGTELTFSEDMSLDNFKWLAGGLSPQRLWCVLDELKAHKQKLSEADALEALSGDNTMWSCQSKRAFLQYIILNHPWFCTKSSATYTKNKMIDGWLTVFLLHPNSYYSRYHTWSRARRIEEAKDATIGLISISGFSLASIYLLTVLARREPGRIIKSDICKLLKLLKVMRD